MRENGRNNHGVPFSVINFFETRLNTHDKITSVERDEDILFHLTLKTGETFDVLLVNDYTISESAVYEYHREFPSAEFIVTGGAWNAYTRQAKEVGKLLGIGIFNTAEFFGALNWSNPKDYYKKDDEGNPVYAIRG